MTMLPIVWINLFSVPKDKESDFLGWWAETKAGLTKGQGFIGGRLYRSWNVDARFNFIKVERWDDELYAEKSGASLAAMKPRLADIGVEIAGAIFTVHEEY